MESFSILHGTNPDVLVRPRRIHPIGEAMLSHISDILFEKMNTGSYFELFDVGVDHCR